MKLWTYQSIDVVGKLYRDKIFFADWDKLNFKEFSDSYEWILNQFNERRHHDFSGPPIFWYTDLKQVKGILQRGLENGVLLSANVPEKWLLLHDFGAWHGPLNHCSNGFSESYLKEWGDVQERIWLAYKANPQAMAETWKGMFHIPKRDRHLIDTHAVTPFLDFYWISPKESKGEDKFEM